MNLSLATRVLAITLAIAFFAHSAAAQGRGGGAGGRLAQGSVAGANRMDARPAGSRNNVGGNAGNASGNRVNTGNVNIGNDVNIDIDHDYDNHWGHHVDHPVAAAITVGAVAVTTRAIVGSYYYALPPGCTVVYRNGIAYHYCGTVYYSQSWYGNDVVYVVVNP